MVRCETEVVNCVTDLLIVQNSHAVKQPTTSDVIRPRQHGRLLDRRIAERRQDTGTIRPHRLPRGFGLLKNMIQQGNAREVNRRNIERG